MCIFSLVIISSVDHESFFYMLVIIEGNTFDALPQEPQQAGRIKEQATTMTTIVLALKKNGYFSLLMFIFPIDESTLYLYEETEFIYLINKAHSKEIKLFDF